MSAENIYQILDKYRKNPDRLRYDGSLLVQQIEYFIDHQLPIVFVFPGCHGKVNNRDLVIDHMPDLSEYFGIERIARMCMEIEALHLPGVQLFMVHEGHFYVDTVLIQSDETMDEYIFQLRKMLKYYPFIRSLTLKDFFDESYSHVECRKMFFEQYAPTLSVVDQLIEKEIFHKNLYHKYFDGIFYDFQQQYLENKDHFLNYEQYVKYNATQQLQIWIGFRNLLKKHFSGVNFIRLSSVFKDPSVTDQVAMNYIPDHHLEKPSFRCVVKLENGSYGFIKRKDAIEKKLTLSDHLGYKFYMAVKHNFN